jgi:hypothetical protein
MKHLGKRLYSGVILALILALVLVAVALASGVDVSVVDVHGNDSITLAPGGSAPIVIQAVVTGRQDDSAVFEIDTIWTLSADGAFIGSVPQAFTVPAQVAGTTTYFAAAGTVIVPDGQEDGTFMLEVKARVTQTSSPAALSARYSGFYEVTVESLSAPEDTTPPSITISTPLQGDVFLLGEVISANYFCEDEAGGSGLDYCDGDVPNGDAIDTSSVGAKSFTVNAADNVGNAAEAMHSYSVIYDFDGFYQPIGNAVRNGVKAGRAIPVKFSLNGYHGWVPSAASFGISCTTPDPVSHMDDGSTSSAGSSSWQFDAAEDQYVYVWKTLNNWSGTCRRLIVTLNDGTQHSADFQFTK